jgi:hypothetical protein
VACTPLSVGLALLAPDDQRQVYFGLTRHCNPDGSSFWMLDFVLSQLRNGAMKPRVTLQVTIGEDKQKRAESLAASRKLSPAQLSLLQNQIADRAASLSPKKATTDPVLLDLLQRLL